MSKQPFPAPYSLDHFQLVADILEFAKADVNLNAPTIGDLWEQLPDWDRKVISRLVKALVDTGLLYSPPHLNARASRYATTPMGVKVAEAYRQLAEDRADGSDDL